MLMLTGVNAGNELVTISKSFWTAPSYHAKTLALHSCEGLIPAVSRLL